MAHGRSPRHQRRPRKAGARRARTGGPPPAPSSGPVRLQKILAAAGVASRRAAEDLIRQGRVTVNGRPAQIGVSADPGVDEIALDGERVRVEAPRYWILHKPKGVVTTLADPHGRRSVKDLVPGSAGRVYPVGRLDRDSAGLVLLTNDGALAQLLLHPSRESEKEYRVTVRGQLEDRAVARLCRGVHLEDGLTKPARVERLRYDADDDATTFLLTLTEGRKRQIRRMLLTLGHPVKKLVRVRIGPIRLGRLAPGATRPLRGDEVRALRVYASRLERSPPPRRAGGRSSGRRKPAGAGPAGRSPGRPGRGAGG